MNSDLNNVVWISVGAILGANLRYFVSNWAAQKWGAAFPFGTLLVNLVGALLLGLLLTVALERFLVDPRWRTLLTVGFLRSYTTFSTYAYESVVLILKGQWLPGLANLLGSALLGALACIVGIWAGKSL